MIKLNTAITNVLRHGLKNTEEGSDEDEKEENMEEDGNHVYYAVETWMTMIELNKAMSQVLRHGLKNNEDGSNEDEKEEEHGNHMS